MLGSSGSTLRRIFSHLQPLEGETPSLELVNRFPLIKEKAYINGAWVGSSMGKTFEVKNPANGEVIANVANLGDEETKLAINAAHEAFMMWRWTTARERAALLKNWFNLCQANGEELAKIVTTEQGKPLAQARAEVGYGNSFIEWFAEETKRINGNVIPPVNNKNHQMMIKQPIGVAGIITPWNFPNAMITRKLGAALASGCTVVCRPAEDTPLSALAVITLAEEAGFPKGVINIVTSDRSNASSIGKAICKSPKVAALSFTGSTRVGKLLYKQCGETVKKLSLELGGNSPFIVFDSADLDLAVAGCMASKFRNAGQACIATNRVLVQARIYNDFVAKLKEMVEKTMVLGDGMDQEVNQGPLVNHEQFKKVSTMVDEALAKGAKLISGGSKHHVGDLQYKPTILTNVTNDMSLMREEVFGPVISIKKFETEEEALEFANDSRMGLAGYFYSNDMNQCWRVAQRMEVGMVGINEGMMNCPEAPFGGIKESGIGREGSKYGIDEFMEMKYLHFGNLKLNRSK